jgi:hypothetical protein
MHISSQQIIHMLFLLPSCCLDAKGGVEDEDGYFDDDTSDGSAKAQQLITQWAKSAVEISNSYTGAVGMLQQGGAGAGAGAVPAGSKEGVAVVLNACTVHLQDINHHGMQWGHGKKDDFDMDRSV